MAFTLAAWFIVSPGVVFLRTTCFMSIWCRSYCWSPPWRWFISFGTHAFFGRCSSLRRCSAWSLVRNFFHLAYFVAILAALAYLFPARRRTRISLRRPAAARDPGTLHEELDALWKLLRQHLDGHEHGRHHRSSIDRRRSEGLRQPRRDLAGFAAGSRFAHQLSTDRTFKMPAPTGIPVLDDCVTSTGATNFNCRPFSKSSGSIRAMGWRLLRNYPVVYLRSVEAAWFSYFLPAGRFSVLRSESAQDSRDRSVLECRVLWPVQRSERSQGTQAIGRAGRASLTRALYRRVSNDRPAGALAVEHLTIS